MFRIAQISDTHLSREKPFFVDSFRRSMAAIAVSGCDLVLNTGDVSLDGAESEDDLAAARAWHDETGLPTRYIPGNHDIGDNQELGAAAHRLIDAHRRARYIRHFGPDWWSLDLPGWRLIAVNAQLIGADFDAAGEQDAFIAEAASGAGQRAVTLVIHKPLFDAAEEESAVGGRFLNPVPRRHLLQALGHVRPRLVINGHVHQYRRTEPEHATHVWCPSTGFIVPDERQPTYGVKTVGYVEHQLGADGSCESRFVRVDGVPILNIGDFPQAYPDHP